MSTQRDTPKPQEGTAPADEGVQKVDTPDDDDRDAGNPVENDPVSDDDDRDDSQGHDDPTPDDGDRDARPHGNREAAKYRVRAREAEQKLEAVTAELEALKEANFVRDLSGLYASVKGETLHALGLTRQSVTGEDGSVDMGLVRERADSLVKQHGLVSVIPGQPPVTGDRFGPFRVEGAGASWSDLLRGSSR
jgi:PAS domain-containing protein